VDLAKDFRAFFLAGVNYTPQKLTPRRQGRPPKQHNVAAQAVEKEQP
jgi:hypothetical protein